MPEAWGGGSVLWHGVYGIATSNFETTKLDGHYERYVGEKIATFRDDGGDYGEFMSARMSELLVGDRIDVEERSMMSCTCGVVSIDKEAYDSMPIKKLKHVEDRNGLPACLHCGDVLHTGVMPRLVLKPGFVSNMSIRDVILPHYTAKKTAELLERLNQRTQIISKHGIDRYYPTFTADNYKFRIDPDFWMLGTPLFSGREHEFVNLVAGADQQARLLGALAFWSLFREVDSIGGVLHPKIRFQGETDELRDMTATDFSDKYSDVRIARAMIAKAINWKSHNATLTKEAFLVAKKTVRFTDCLEKPARICDTVANFIDAMNPQTINETFKNIRRGELDNDSQVMIAYAVLGIVDKRV